MESIVFLLVCEGQSDILVMKEIAKKVSSEIGKNIEIREHAPVRDATSREYPSYGWKEVRHWCRTNGHAKNIAGNGLLALAAKRKNWRSLIGIDGIVGFIIHIDTDIVQFIDELPSGYTGKTKKERKKFSKNAILNWLDENDIPSEMHFVLSTYSTETWLLATHLRDEDVFKDLAQDFDYEEINDEKERLIALNYEAHVVDGKNKLIKHENIYKDYAKRIANKLVMVRENCDEANLLVERLENLKKI